MKFLKIVLILLLCISIYSCDIFSFAEIINKSDKEITVEILYDQADLEQVPGLKSIKPYFSNETQLISFDSLTMIGKLKIEPKDSLCIASNRGSSPRFEFIKSLKIFTNDTIVLTNRNEISKLFIETSPCIFTWEIK
jgi:hypothetical protein